MIRYLSKLPLIFEHNDQIYDRIRNILADYALTARPGLFEFTAVNDSNEHVENNRSAYDIAALHRENSDFRSEIENWVTKILARLLAEHRILTVGSSYQLKKNINSLRLAVRVRYMQDRYPYMLGPHKDSSDTLMACILQMSQTNPKTTFFIKHPRILTIKSTTAGLMPVEKQIEKLVIKLTGSSEYIENPFTFKKGITEIWLKNPDRVLLVAKESDSVLRALQYDAINYELDWTSLLCFNNPRTDFAFTSLQSKLIQENYCHGLSPQHFEQRNLLLIDVLQAEEEPNREIVWNNTGNEIWHTYSHTDSRELFRLAGIN